MWIITYNPQKLELDYFWTTQKLFQDLISLMDKSVATNQLKALEGGCGGRTIRVYF